MKNSLSPISERIIQPVVGLLPAIGVLVDKATRPSEIIVISTARPVGDGEVSDFRSDTDFCEHAEYAGRESAKRQNGKGQLHYRNHDGCNQERGQVAPHDFPVNQSATARSDKRCENRENHCRHYCHEIRTQLLFTLRLISRTGKLILDDVIRRGVNSFASLISAISTVSRVRLVALTFSALLLAACASVHSDDACARSYSADGHASHVGRSA
jgi:hypothetical protein